MGAFWTPHWCSSNITTASSAFQLHILSRVALAQTPYTYSITCPGISTIVSYGIVTRCIRGMIDQFKVLWSITLCRSIRNSNRLVAASICCLWIHRSISRRFYTPPYTSQTKNGIHTSHFPTGYSDRSHSDAGELERRSAKDITPTIAIYGQYLAEQWTV